MPRSSFETGQPQKLGIAQLRALHDVATLVHVCEEYDEVLNAASEASRPQLRHRLMALALLDRRHGVLEVRRAGEHETLRLATDSSGLGSVLASGKPKLLESPGSPVLPGCRSVAAAPMWVEGGRPGLLLVGSDEAEWFTEDDLQLLTGMAGHISVAIDRLLGTLREGRRTLQLRLVSEVAEAAVSTLEPELLLRRVVERVHERLGKAFSSIWTLADDGARLRLAAVAGTGSLQPGLETSSALGILGQCLESQETVLVRDTRRQQNYVNHPAYPGLSEICVPIRARSKILALLNIEADLPDAFDEETGTALLAVAGLTGAALENGALFKEVQRFNQTLREQLTEATTELATANQSIAAQKALLEAENKSLKAKLGKERNSLNIIGSSRSLREALQMAERVGNSEATCLIQGESGTGKELFARLIHRVSPRATKPYVALNCAAIPENLLESTMFGHERGAFTGAGSRSSGLVQTAAGGTLFLDELGEMSQALQTKLLRFLQSGEFYRVGGTDLLHADVRIVSATNRDLKKEIDAGRFRSDLYFRVAALMIEVPPLRMRADDITVLVRHFLDRSERGRHMRPTPELLEALEAYPWPGNIRELENVVARMVVLADGPELGPEVLSREVIEEGSLPPASARSVREPSLVLTLDELERTAVQRALARRQGNKKAAAGDLGIALRTLYNKLQRFEKSSSSLRPGGPEDGSSKGPSIGSKGGPRRRR